MQLAWNSFIFPLSFSFLRLALSPCSFSSSPTLFYFKLFLNPIIINLLSLQAPSQPLDYNSPDSDSLAYIIALQRKRTYTLLFSWFPQQTSYDNVCAACSRNIFHSRKTFNASHFSITITVIRRMRQNFMNFALDGLVHSPHTAAARRRTYSSWRDGGARRRWRRLPNEKHFMPAPERIYGWILKHTFSGFSFIYACRARGFHEERWKKLVELKILFSPPSAQLLPHTSCQHVVQHMSVMELHLHFLLLSFIPYFSFSFFWFSPHSHPTHTP